MIARPYTNDDDKTIKQMAGLATTEEIGIVLGRTSGSVRSRMKKLGISNKKYGEHHQHAKMTNLQAAAIGALHDAGFSASEIYTLITQPLDVTKHHVSQVAAGRKRYAYE